MPSLFTYLMSKVIDLTNQKFGKLIAISRSGSTNSGIALWLCKCDCGNIVIVKGAKLRNGHTKSCGCMRVETIRENSKNKSQEKIIENNIITRKCYKCNQELPKEMFVHYNKKDNKLANICKDCRREQKKIWALSTSNIRIKETGIIVDRSEYKDILRFRRRNYYYNNKNKINLHGKEYYYKNIEEIRKKHREYYINNKHLYYLNSAKLRKAYRWRFAAYSAKRRSLKRSATPAWANLEEIKLFYKLSACLTRVTGIKYEVDHIVPLQGKNVCGLHVETNLQVISKCENRGKSNKY